jgi:hypothetical protein
MKFEIVLPKSPSATPVADGIAAEAAPESAGLGETDSARSTGRCLSAAQLRAAKVPRIKNRRSQQEISGRPETGTHVTSFNLIKVTCPYRATGQ